MSNPLIEMMIAAFDEATNHAYSLQRFAAEGDTHADLLELFDSIAEHSEGEVREGYSGRGMYGDECWGIVGDATKILAVAGAHGLIDGANMDSMGRNSIVYWPAIKYNSPENEDEA